MTQKQSEEQRRKLSAFFIIVLARAAEPDGHIFTRGRNAPDLLSPLQMINYSRKILESKTEDIQSQIRAYAHRRQSQDRGSHTETPHGNAQKCPLERFGNSGK